ncbi:MAG: carboxypeptidase-like regulatory domain-containing protein [Cytophagales bacterium]
MSAMFRSLIFVMLAHTSFAQLLVEGVVRDKETGLAVPFASVGVPGTTKGTSTNAEGQFSLSLNHATKIKVSCVGYESVEVNADQKTLSILLKPISTELEEVIILEKKINATRVARQALSSVARNFNRNTFVQTFFYRHYCKDDSLYGRLIEASVDLWRTQGYRAFRATVGEKDPIRINQLRRSLDRTALAQGHEPISVQQVLQADVAAFQAEAPTQHVSFFREVSDLYADFDRYIFSFAGATSYDGHPVYKINYERQKDSVQTKAGYRLDPQISGTLYVEFGTHAIVRATETKTHEGNIAKATAHYNVFQGKYYPYHLSRESRNVTRDGVHITRIDLISTEIHPGRPIAFSPSVATKEALLKIPYDSIFWQNATMLKTTPLEDEIIQDLGGGNSLQQQFQLYQQYERNLTNVGENGAEKFRWFRNYSKHRQILYVVFWSGRVLPYLYELEHAKRLQKKFRGKVQFVLLSLDEDVAQWTQEVNRYNLFAEGIIHFRVGRDLDLMKEFKVREVPGFRLIERNGNKVDFAAKHPGNPQLEEDLAVLIREPHQ